MTEQTDCPLPSSHSTGAVEIGSLNSKFNGALNVIHEGLPR